MLKAALLLETLLLDALVARPETAGTGHGRGAAGGGGGAGGGQSGAVSPKVGWTGAGGGGGGGGSAATPGDSLIASGARGGVLGEADQRVLQVRRCPLAVVPRLHAWSSRFVFENFPTTKKLAMVFFVQPETEVLPG